MKLWLTTFLCVIGICFILIGINDLHNKILELLLTFIGIIIFLIPVVCMIYTVFNKCLTKKKNKNISDLIEVQLNDAFFIENPHEYSKLNTDDYYINSNKTPIRGIVRYNSDQSVNIINV